jgi:hypothetical protein
MTYKEFAFRVERRAVRSVCEAFWLHPSSDPYVSGDSFRSLADRRLEERGHFDPASVAEGDIVFVKTDLIPRFLESDLPRIKSRFILVSHNSDHCVDDRLVRFADDERIGRWYAQNLLAKHPKVEAIPIGLENRCLHTNGVTRDFDRLRAAMPPKKYRILYAFSVGTNPGERGAALEALKGSSLADGPQWTISPEYRRALASYAFVASPPGNGFDCHRTWEALYLDALPVVKRAPFFDAFPELPALTVDDWREVTDWNEEFLHLAYARLQPKIAACPYIRMDYWRQRIEGQRKAIREGK